MNLNFNTNIIREDLKNKNKIVFISAHGRCPAKHFKLPKDITLKTLSTPGEKVSMRKIPNVLKKIIENKDSLEKFSVSNIDLRIHNHINEGSNINDQEFVFDKESYIYVYDIDKKEDYIFKGPTNSKEITNYEKYFGTSLMNSINKSKILNIRNIICSEKNCSKTLEEIMGILGKGQYIYYSCRSFYNKINDINKFLLKLFEEYENFEFIGGIILSKKDNEKENFDNFFINFDEQLKKEFNEEYIKIIDNLNNDINKKTFEVFLNKCINYYIPLQIYLFLFKKIYNYKDEDGNLINNYKDIVCSINDFICKFKKIINKLENIYCNIEINETDEIRDKIEKNKILLNKYNILKTTKINNLSIYDLIYPYNLLDNIIFKDYSKQNILNSVLFVDYINQNFKEKKENLMIKISKGNEKGIEISRSISNTGVFNLNNNSGKKRHRNPNNPNNTNNTNKISPPKKKGGNKKNK